MRKIVDNKDFSAIEVRKMYDDESIICDLITEITKEDGEKEEKIQQGIGFVKEVWQEFIAFTEDELQSLKPKINESDSLVE